MKNQQYAEMYQLYQQGFSLEQVGKAFGVTRQSVYSGFHRRGWSLRQKKELPFMCFNGIKFTRRNTGYLGRTDGNRELMHRYVWRHYHGEIPDGFDVHHRNRDRTDNRIENLELISRAEHARKYNTGCNGFQHKCGK